LVLFAASAEASTVQTGVTVTAQVVNEVSSASVMAETVPEDDATWFTTLISWIKNLF
jgi:hypothetical protein